mgnify:CR=1 FL=1|tara:strand:+ start:1091 stop:1303 length:213 start_codon:yes stop_codon:yes gene_type:complete
MRTGIANGYHVMALESQGRRIQQIMDEVERSVKDSVTGELKYLVERSGQLKLPFEPEISRFREYQKIIER